MHSGNVEIAKRLCSGKGIEGTDGDLDMLSGPTKATIVTSIRSSASWIF
jgi:hypothetical protein